MTVSDLQEAVKKIFFGMRFKKCWNIFDDLHVSSNVNILFFFVFVTLDNH